MKTAKRLVLILGDQLSLQSAALDGFDRQTDTILMVESRAEASHVLSHQAKIVLFLSAMRHFAQELRDLQYPLIYIEHSTQSISEVLRDELQNGLWTEVVCIEPGEWRLKQAILEVVEDSECGIFVAEFDSWKQGDTIKAFELIPKKKSTF
jgi:deoxyribodipyrimidine photolyase-related protein